MKTVKFLLIILALFLLQWWFRDPVVELPDSDIHFAYVVKYPAGGGGSRTLPMLVALHGNGDTADNFYATALDRLRIPVRVILLKGPMPYGRGSAWPATSTDFQRYGPAVKQVIEALAEKYPTAGKPVLLGFSGGAMMAYYQAIKYGDSYSSIFAVSGKLAYDWLGDDTSRVDAPVYAYHGKSDNLIPVSAGRNAIDILHARGVETSFTEFEGGHLGIFTSMKPELTRAVEDKIREQELK